RVKPVARAIIAAGLLALCVTRATAAQPALPEAPPDVQALVRAAIPNRVAADKAYQNAKQNSDKQNARIEHDKALARVMTAVLKDDTELFRQFMDNESFKRWLTDTVFRLTYDVSRPAI